MLSYTAGKIVQYHMEERVLSKKKKNTVGFIPFDSIISFLETYSIDELPQVQSCLQTQLFIVQNVLFKTELRTSQESSNKALFEDRVVLHYRKLCTCISWLFQHLKCII